MTGVGGFRPPWRRGRPVAAIEHVPPPMWRRHIATVEMGPRAVRRAREAVAERLPKVGVAPGSAFADAVRLVTSEPAANVLRHAPRSPVRDVGITAAGGHLLIVVADAEPRRPISPTAEWGRGHAW